MCSLAFSLKSETAGFCFELDNLNIEKQVPDSEKDSSDTELLALFFVPEKAEDCNLIYRLVP